MRQPLVQLNEETYMREIRKLSNTLRREEIEEFVHEIGMDAGGHLDLSVVAICDLLEMLDGRTVPPRDWARRKPRG